VPISKTPGINTEEAYSTERRLLDSGMLYLEVINYLSNIQDVETGFRTVPQLRSPGPGPSISISAMITLPIRGWALPPPRQPASPPPLPYVFDNIQAATAIYELRVTHSADNTILYRVSEAQLTRFSATYIHYLKQQMRHKRRAIRKCL
jgi:hypothetical protein